MTDSSQRLNKFLAFHLGISRRQADELIEAGKVAINDTVAIIGGRVRPEDRVIVNGKPLAQKQHTTTIALHKPEGYVCSRRQQGETPTIYSLLPSDLHHLKPVGRLDANSSGIILLTDDGDLAQQMTHPKYAKTKRYIAQLDKDLEPLHQQMINDFGVMLEDGPSQLTLERESETSRRGWIVTMSEGRNRQIRRTFSALGYAVLRLHRTDFGIYTLGSLKQGSYRIITS